MPLPIVFAGIVAVYESAFVLAMGQVVRAFAWALITAVSAEIARIIKNAILSWLRENGPEMVGKGIELQLGIDLNGRYSKEGFTDAINRAYGTEFTDLFDPEAVRRDAERMALKSINSVFYGNPLQSLDAYQLQVDLPRAVGESMMTALRDGSSFLFRDVDFERVVNTIASKKPPGFGPEPPVIASMDDESVAARERWNKWRATKNGYEWV